MFTEPVRSDDTIARYEIDATKIVGQYCREHPAEVCHAPYETRVTMCVGWFLDSDGRWSDSTIRGIAAALTQRVEMFVRMDLIYDNPEPAKSLLWRLKNARPQSRKKAKKSKKAKKEAHQKKVAAKKMQRKAPRKSIPLRELRALVQYFRDQADGFSLWIAGYILIASRLGWRPGEIVSLRREGDFLRTRAEKHTNGRGLTDTCEVDISAYPKRLIDRLDQWIAAIEKWEEKYGGLWQVRRAMNERLATASDALGIERVCTYTFRHFAIACMKRSGFSKSEIAAIVNHASNRTATEKYGKARDGIKRAKKMLRFNEERLQLVRDPPRKSVKDLQQEQSPSPSG
ncbi:site-specific integrase [Bradyrhizobium diazoefficiens]|nr:site-specific integrase [Bradyrhizobium diazoefficiens]MBR0850259.1 site-specific integrase [Bradyrhizobium diazoefficiens]